MNQLQRVKFNLMAFLGEEDGKLSPSTEIVFITSKANWVVSKNKKTMEKGQVIDELRMVANKKELLQMKADLDHVIRNMDTMQSICDNNNANIVIEKVGGDSKR